MKYSVEVIINCSVDHLSAIMCEPNTLSNWMKGLQHQRLIEDSKGKSGTHYMLEFKWEKVLRVVEPSDNALEFKQRFVSPTVINRVDDKLSRTPENKVRLSSYNEFQFRGLLKYLARMVPQSLFERQTLKHLNRLKDYAESSEQANHSH